MPRINRIRIANVPYHGKYIVDQIINSYNGENILINLANGGGKSVLTQMIMQPIIPNVKIHKRKVDTYLTSKEPTFVMIEWLLDNTKEPTYFLTGIVMNKATTEDNSYRIRYFTFINEYKASNPYDLKNIDFISSENGLVKYKSYEYCIKSLRERENAQSKIRVFSMDEQKSYNSKLEEVGIFKDEWRILAKINEKEGGIDDLFEKCEKADDVVNQWILKAISDKLENDDSLKEMFLNLMMDILKHEEEIKQKEELEAFKVEADSYINELSDLLNSMKLEEDKLKELESIYLKLKTLEISKQTEIENIDSKIIAGNEELNTIGYEELSEEYYKFEQSLNEINEKADKLILERDKKEEIFKKAKQDLKVICASKIYEDYKNAKADKEAVLVSKKALEDKLDDEFIKDVEFSLKCKYEEQITLVTNAIEEKKKELEKIISEKNENDELIEQKRKLYLELQNRLAVISNNIEQFAKKEKEILAELKLNLTRNILKELDSKEVENTQGLYLLNTKTYNDSILEDKDKIKNNDKKITENIEEINVLDENIKSIVSKLTIKETELDNFNRNIKKIKNILNMFSISDEKLFDNENNLAELNRQKEFVRNRNNLNCINLNKQNEIWHSLESDTVHVEAEIGRVLSANNIAYETGDEYLKGQTKETQTKLLEKNPMLPYCYIILNSKDYKNVESLLIENKLNRIVPIILFEDIEVNLKKEKKLVCFDDKINFLCLYNEKAFDKELVEEFKDEISNEIEELKEEIRNDDEKISNLNEAINFISNHLYTESDEDNLKHDIMELKEEKDGIENKKKLLDDVNDKLRLENQSVRDEIVALQKALEENENCKNKFEKFLEENDRYMKLLNDKNSLNSESLENMEIIEKLNKRILELSEKMQEIKLLSDENERNLGELELKISKFSNSVTGNKLDKDLEELEKMYEQVHDEFKKDENEIARRLDEATKKMSDSLKELGKKYKDVEGLYEEKNYSEIQEDIQTEKCEKSEKEFESVKEELTKVTLEKAKLESNMENAKANLRKIGKNEPLKGNLIKGNYNQRRKSVLGQIEGWKFLIVSIKKEMSQIIKKQNLINRKFETDPEYKEMDISKFDYNNLHIDEILSELSVLKKLNDSKKRRIDNLYKDIENKNRDARKIILDFIKNMNPCRFEEKFADYYFTYERMSDCLVNFEKILHYLETTIASIENDKNNIKYHAYTQGKNIYLEMKQISESAYMKFSEKQRKTALMEIELPRELDQYAKDRMDEYIETCIKDLRNECRDVQNIRQIVDKKITDRLSDRQLLNIVINSETIGVKLYKIDISEKNSGLRKWEDVIVGNSGGEKLISCLIMVLALMQYTRSKIFAKYGEENIETSKFLIIDNPFGKMSSIHLLNGLILILQKFNVQAICLSDISQSSITNNFKVIYQMSLKNGMYSDKIYLTTDNIVKSPEVTENYLLQHAFVKSEDQVRIW